MEKQSKKRKELTQSPHAPPQRQLPKSFVGFINFFFMHFLPPLLYFNINKLTNTVYAIFKTF